MLERIYLCEYNLSNQSQEEMNVGKKSFSFRSSFRFDSFYANSLMHTDKNLRNGNLRSWPILGISFKVKVQVGNKFRNSYTKIGIDIHRSVYLNDAPMINMQYA